MTSVTLPLINTRQRTLSPINHTTTDIPISIPLTIRVECFVLSYLMYDLLSYMTPSKILTYFTIILYCMRKTQQKA